MNYHSFHVIFRAEPEGGFTAVVPALPGCITYGKDLEQAKVMARDAIYSYIESLHKHREPIPSDNQSFFSSVEIMTSAPIGRPDHFHA